MPAHQRRGPRIVAGLILIVAVAAIIYALIDKRAPPRTASPGRAGSPTGPWERPSCQGRGREAVLCPQRAGDLTPLGAGGLGICWAKAVAMKAETTPRT
jgi:hypothetical protein